MKPENTPRVLRTGAARSLLRRFYEGEGRPKHQQPADALGGTWGRHVFYHADGNGNVTALIDSAQTVVAAHRYNPYGQLLGSSGSLAGVNTLRFSSKPWFQSEGLYYYGYRFYAPDLQRWLNRDPIGELGGINLYAFVSNDPANRLDSLGQEPILTTLAVCAALYSAGQGLIGARSYRSTSESVDAYRGAVRRMEQRYGDHLPDSIQEYLDRWRQELAVGFGPRIIDFAH